MTRDQIAAATSPEQVLEGMAAAGEIAVDSDGHLWAQCGNCGGTGRYPSSMAPAGRCRFHCWQSPFPGMRHQNSDARQWAAKLIWYYRAQIAKDAELAERRAALAAELTKRIESPDPIVARALALRGLTAKGLWAGGQPAHFMDSICWQWLHSGRLTPAQSAALEKAVVRDEERAAARAAERAAAPAWQAGRLTITGAVIKAEWRPGFRSFDGQHLALTIKLDDGRLAWLGNLPWRQMPDRPAGADPHSYDLADAIKGAQITTTVTITPSDRDATFGIAKRAANTTVTFAQES